MVIAHEFGHNFSLGHHGAIVNGYADEYYDGHSGGGVPSWAALMGSGYGRNVAQWSNGQYLNAEKPYQADVEWIGGRTGYRPDDHGDTVSTATSLTLDGTLQTPSRPLYTFLGWHTASTGGSLVTAASFVTNSNKHTLYARWQTDVTAPTVVCYSPADGSSGVPMSSGLVITFSELVVFGTGTIRLRKTGLTAIETFDVANPPANLSINGNVVTIVPTTLEEGLNHYVQIDNTAIKNLAGNAYVGITLDTTWNFSVTAADTLLYDNFNGTTYTTINQNISARQQGTMATSSYTIEAGLDQKFSSSKLKTVSGQRVVNDADFKTILTGAADPGVAGFTLRIKIENDGTGPVYSYLSTHSGTDDRSASRFGLHVLESANTNAFVAYGNIGGVRSQTTVTKATLNGLLGTTFTASLINTFTMVASATSSTAGTYDLFVNGVQVLSDIPYLLGAGGSNSKIQWESHNASGDAYLDDFMIKRTVNTAPVWTSNPITGADATEGVAYSGTLAGLATDTDGQSLTYALVSAPTWLSVASNGTLSGTPGPSHVGPNSFTVRVSDGLATAVQTTLNITVQTAFESWVTDGAGQGVTFNGDVNHDGVADGLAWLLGSATPAAKANALLPAGAVVDQGKLTIGFDCLKASKRGTARLTLQFSNSLAANSWTSVEVPETSGTVDGVAFNIAPIDGSDLNQVQATVPASAAGGSGKAFVRLSAEIQAP